MIPVTVTNLSISNVGFVVLLKSQKDARTLPIYIGPPEAQAILFWLNKVQLPRPITHDLFKNVLDILEARLECVVIHDLREGTFYGRLVLAFEGQRLDVDSRPSDAIALALRCHAPIFVEDSVMDAGAVVLDSDGAKAKKAAAASMVRAPNAAAADSDDSPVSKLKAQLQRAIDEERYEEAARLRDEIKRAANTN
jgi:bifunctional DNase/RNase